jgi:hypothetical protein
MFLLFQDLAALFYRSVLFQILGRLFINVLLFQDLAALFYRSVLFLSVLFQILGRLFILVFFAYSFGPGRYYPLLIFLGKQDLV